MENNNNKFHKVSIEEWLKSNSTNTFPPCTISQLTEAYSKIELPTRSSKHSAGYDFKIPYSVTIEPHSSVVINSGVSCELDTNKFLQLVPRSSIGIKKGLYLLNTLGVIDSDYFSNSDNGGHIKIALGNTTDKAVKLQAGDKVIQGIILEYFLTNDDDAQSERIGGIGSSGR